MKFLKNLLLVLITLCVQQLLAEGKHVKASFKVQGNCGMCKNRIEGSLQVAGVAAAQWNPDTKMLRVKYTPAIITLSQIHQIVVKAGHDTDLLKATHDDYEKLEKCCHYRSTKCDHP